MSRFAMYNKEHGSGSLLSFCLVVILAAVACSPRPDVQTDASRAPSPTITVAPDLNATIESANAIASGAQSTQTAQAGQTGTSEALAQAAHNRSETQVWGEVTRNAMTSQARDTVTSRDATHTAATATATAALVYDALRVQQAQLALTNQALEVDQKGLEIRRQNELYLVKTWGPPLAIGAMAGLIILGLFILLVLIVRRHNLREMELFRTGSSYVINVYDPKMSWLRRVLDWLFGTGDKVVVNPGRASHPAVQIDGARDASGNRVRAPVLASEDMQREATRGDHAVQMLRAVRDARQREVNFARALAEQSFTHGETNVSSVTSAGLLPGAKPFNGNGDFIEGEFETITTDDPAYSEAQSWAAELREQMPMDE